MDYVLMPLRRYAEFSGRSRRKEYWMFTLFYVLLWILLVGLMIAIAGSGVLAAAAGEASGLAAAGGSVLIIGAVMFVVWLALLIPSIAVGVRRLHDTGRSGWWLGGYFGLYVVSLFLAGGTGEGGLSMILSFALFAYAIALLVFMLLDGTKGPNKYGPDPKGRADAEVFA